MNEEEDWTSLLFNHTAVLRRISLANIQGLLSDYDGFGIALNPIAIDFPYQIGELIICRIQSMCIGPRCTT